MIVDRRLQTEEDFRHKGHEGHTVKGEAHSETFVAFVVFVSAQG